MTQNAVSPTRHVVCQSTELSMALLVRPLSQTITVTHFGTVCSSLVDCGTVLFPFNVFTRDESVEAKIISRFCKRQRKSIGTGSSRVVFPRIIFFQGDRILVCISNASFVLCHSPCESLTVFVSPTLIGVASSDLPSLLARLYCR